MIILISRGHAAEPGVHGTGQYLKSFDHEAAFDDRAPPGSGRPTFTTDKAKAMRFADMAEFMVWYKRVPTCAPIRWDGEPNRPATGYTWQLVEVAE